MSKVSQSVAALPGAFGADMPLTESVKTYFNYFKKVYEEFAPFLSSEKSFHDNDALGEVEQWSRTHSLLLGDGSIAPITLIPHPIPKEKFQQAKELAPLYGELVDAIAENPQFLLRSLSSVQDPFTRRLIQLYQDSQHYSGPRQSIRFGIHRSDYMVDVTTDRLLQVELNTIASGAGGLATKVNQLHSFMSRWRDDNMLRDSLPNNIALDAIVCGIAQAYHAYLNQQKFRLERLDRTVAVLFVVQQPPEYNQVDQNMVKFGLQEKHGIRVIRKTLADLNTLATVDPSTGVLTVDGYEISVAYFRAGYGPKDYPTESEWSARLLVEKSLAIKCPSIAYQLAGTKKIQQTVADPEVLRQLIPDARKADQLLASFTELLPLGGDDQHILDSILNSATASEDFVMKPQREGGGNLLSKSAMIQALRSLDSNQRSDYILMRRIKPVEVPSLVLRAGQVQVIPNAIAELGIFTVFLKDTRTDDIIRNGYGGFLLRTKSASTEDGGISSRAYLDSPALI